MKDRQERIMQILKEFIAIDSISDSPKEEPASRYIYDFFRDLPYFKEHPDYAGQYAIPHDPHGRTVPYAFLEGKSKDTVVISGHFDVVNALDYGEALPLAFTVGEELEQALAKMELPPAARADMESGEWIWGRGVADMKGGLVVNMALMEEYAEAAHRGELPGCLLFMGVPDEESYSAGMRAGVSLLSDFKDRYGLNYKLLIDPEPTHWTGTDSSMCIGSVGKTMPVVMVQGVTAHVGYCYDGLSPLDILTGIYKRTNGSLEFVDSYDGEGTMPPTWTNLRDMKRLYDVSIPHRACGYCTVLSFTATPDQIIEKFRKIAAEEFEKAVAQLNANYQEFKKLNKFESKEKIHYEPLVLTFGELIQRLKKQDAKRFDAFYEKAYEEVAGQIRAGKTNYPDATISMMERVLDYADIKQPLVLLGFAPPYYPAIHSDMIPGKGKVGTKTYEFIAKAMKEQFGVSILRQHYALGISDLSYCAMDHPFDTQAFSANTPMWGDLYNMDFAAIENNNIPSVLYGPLGKDYHKWTERVNRKSLLEIAPTVTAQLIDAQWK